jgi:hypothetical protein
MSEYQIARQKKLQNFEENIKNFDDLVKQNVRFVKGDLDWAPYHNGPIIEDATESEVPGYEYDKVLEGLVRVNELGFVSIWGFGPLDNNPKEKDEDGNICRQQYKSNFIGYVKRDKIEKFIEYIDKVPEIKYQVYDYLTKKIKSNIREKKFPYRRPIFFLEKATCSEIGDLYKRLFPKLRVNKPAFNYEIPRTFNKEYIEFTSGDFSDRVQNIIKNDAVFVHVALKDFCQDTHPLYCDINFLYDKVAEALIYANGSTSFGKVNSLNKDINYLKQLVC